MIWASPAIMTALTRLFCSSPCRRPRSWYWHSVCCVSVLVLRPFVLLHGQVRHLLPEVVLALSSQITHYQSLLSDRPPSDFETIWLLSNSSFRWRSCMFWAWLVASYDRCTCSFSDSVAKPLATDLTSSFITTATNIAPTIWDFSP